MVISSTGPMHVIQATVLLLLPLSFGALQVDGQDVDLDIDVARIRGQSRFEPFRAINSESLEEALSSGKLQGDTRLLVLDHSAGRLAFMTDQMTYHHVAQGEMMGEPWMISFWVVCNTGVGLTPTVEGVVHHFRTSGIYNGLSLLRDDETGAIWNHITGQAVHGPLTGTRLPLYNLLHMTVQQALDRYPELAVAISDRPVRGRRGLLAPTLDRVPFLRDNFKSTIVEEDTRLPTMEIGLRVWTDSEQRYYPMETVQEADGWLSTTLTADAW